MTTLVAIVIMLFLYMCVYISECANRPQKPYKKSFSFSTSMKLHRDKWIFEFWTTFYFSSLTCSSSCSLFVIYFCKWIIFLKWNWILLFDGTEKWKKYSLKWVWRIFYYAYFNWTILLNLFDFFEDQPDAAFNPNEKLSLNRFKHCTSLLILQFIKWIYAVSFSWPILLSNIFHRITFHIHLHTIHRQ